MNKLSSWHRQGPNYERRALGWLWAIARPHKGGWSWRVGQSRLGTEEYSSCAETLWGACADANEALRKIGMKA